MGPFGSNIKAENFQSSGVPVIRGTNMNFAKFVGGEFVYLSDDKADELARSNCFPGDLVFTHRGTIGQVALIPKSGHARYVISQSGMRASPDKTMLDSEFLFYFFRSPIGQNQLLQNESQVGVPSISSPLSSLKAVRLLMPPLAEQKAIAEVLSSLDDKIDLLHRQNATLEALAETLFRQYFIEEAQDDWEDGILDDVLTVKGGTTPSTKNSAFWDGDIHWTSPRDLSGNNGLFLLDTARKITPEGLAQIGSGLLPAGSLLMSSRAPVGYLAFSVNPVAINQGYIGILDDKGFSKEFIFLWLKINMEYVKGHANGSTFQEISKSTFKRLEITKPPEQLRQKFQELATPIFEKLLTNTWQCQNLQRLRESLLPRLMSGAVRVHVSV